MEGDFVLKTSDFVNVSISASFPCACIERRFPRGVTVADLKGKLELATGASSNTMKVSVFDKQDKLVCHLDNDEALLGSYHVDDGMRLHVEDSFTLRKEIEDDQSEDVRYKLSEEEYDKRADSLKAFLKQNKVGKYNEEEMASRREAAEREDKKESELAAKIAVGNRVKVTVPGNMTRLGTVEFVGPVQFKVGHPWVGVKYDEPLGKNDGSCEGVRYFECLPKYGGFVKPSFVEVGDFPEEELELDEI